MGRKTNSVSLRLKKTNRDYNNCWYSDILYADSFSKSLKIQNYLSQTLKTVGMPCPQTSVIGAFKKAALLVCYLDPKKQKRLLEKSSKSVQSKARALQASVSLNSKKSFLSLGKVKQDSKALLKPLDAILQTNFGPLPLLYRGELPLTADHSSYSTGAAMKVVAKQKPNHDLYREPAKLEQTLVSIAALRKQAFLNKKFLVKKEEEKADIFSDKIIRPFYFYRGSVGLDLVENKKFHVNQAPLTSFEQPKPSLSKYSICNFLCLIKGSETTKKMPCNLPTLDYLKKNDQGKKKGLFLEKNLFSRNSISNELFLQKQTSQVNHVIRASALKKNLSTSNFTGLQVFPFFFEKEKSSAKIWSRFINFYEFFQNEISNLALISAFSKNSQIFGKKKGLSYAFNNTPFSCLSEFSLIKNKFCVTKSSNKKQVFMGKAIIPQKIELIGYNPTLYQKKENCSLTSLYGFYNGISSFWGNLVSLYFYKSTNETCCALFLAECVSYLLEKKVSFRSIKRVLLLELNQSNYSFSAEKLPLLWASHTAESTSQAFALPVLLNKRKVTGIRITCSGRVGGRSKKAQRSRKDTFMWGETGLHVFSSKLDFHKTHAETPFGLVGVQVWVCSK